MSSTRTTRARSRTAALRCSRSAAMTSRSLTWMPQSSSRPGTPSPYFNRAEVYSRLGDRDKAIADYDEAVRLDSRMAAAYAASARLRDENGQRDRAMHDYDMALKLDPKQVSLYYDRGNVRREAGDWRGAIADYDQAVALDPKRAETYFAQRLVAFLGGCRRRRLRRPRLHLASRVARSTIPVHGCARGTRLAASRTPGRGRSGARGGRGEPLSPRVARSGYSLPEGRTERGVAAANSREQAPADRSPRVYRGVQAATRRPHKST